MRNVRELEAFFPRPVGGAFKIKKEIKKIHLLWMVTEKKVEGSAFSEQAAKTEFNVKQKHSNVKLKDSLFWLTG